MRISNQKLGIGIPLDFHMVPSAFFDSFIAMEKPDFLYFRTSTGHIDDMRDSIVRDALAAGCSKLLMLDTDQLYPPDTLTRLLSHKKPIVGARVRRRYPPFDNLFYRGHVGAWEPVTAWKEGDLIEVDVTGTGCLLFDMQVFRRIPPPWFVTTTEHGRVVGEDFNFCLKARKAGYSLYVDTGVYVAHLSQFGITDSFADTYDRVVAARATKEAVAA